jgi:hypothetical protein
MSKRPTKREIHQQMQQEISQFLNQGGEVHEFERGESGLVNGKLGNRTSGFAQGKQQRTPLNQVLNTLDERKKTNTPATPKTPRKPYKKIIYDDFGEPVREVWVE